MGDCRRRERPRLAAHREREWVEEIRLQCRAADVPFFFKQWGGVRKKAAGRELNGRFYDEMPHICQLTS